MLPYLEQNESGALEIRERPMASRQIVEGVEASQRQIGVVELMHADHGEHERHQKHRERHV